MLNTTDEKRLRALMNRDPEANELFQKLMDDQHLTISTISHELRNPLTIIHGTIQVIESAHPEVMTDNLWPRLKNDVQQMRHLLEDLSAYNNRNELKKSTFSMEDFLYDLADSFYYSLETESDITFTSDIDEDLPAYTGDRSKLHEVILNLLVNARDAVGTSGSICLAAAYGNDSIRISVEDTGHGISQEHLAHIFKPFITYKKQGTGLGLAIARSIVESHLGSIEVARTSSEGTVFLITLPLA